MAADDLKSELSEVKVTVARVEAIVEEIRDRQRDEIDALFERTQQQEARLAAVEANYVRRADNDLDHREFRTAITEQRVGLAKMVVVSAILAALGSAALTATLSAVAQKAFGNQTTAAK